MSAFENDIIFKGALMRDVSFTVFVGHGINEIDEIWQQISCTEFSERDEILADR